MMRSEPALPRPPRIWRPNLIVFLSSSCIMVLELVIGRITASYVGMSLYTWTVVIGVVLAGISLGNYLGGRLADRFPSRGMLSLIFLAAGMASLSVLATDGILGRAMAPSSLPLILRILGYATLVFFLPGCILGMVSPLVVKLSLEEALERVDKYLDDAAISQHGFAKLLHGYGTGVLRKALHEFLASHCHVKSFRLGTVEEGGEAVTIVELH